MASAEIITGVNVLMYGILATLVVFVIVGEAVLFIIFLATRGVRALAEGEDYPLGNSRTWITFNVLGVLLFAITATSYLADRMVLSNMWEITDVIAKVMSLDKLRDRIIDMEDAGSSYLLIHNKRFIPLYTDANHKATEAIEEIDRLYEKGPRQDQASYAIVLAQFRLNEMNVIRDLELSGKHEAALDLVKANNEKNTRGLFLTVIDNLKHHERDEALRLHARNKSVVEWLSYLKAALMVCAVVLLVLGSAAQRRAIYRQPPPNNPAPTVEPEVCHEHNGR